MAQSDGPTKDEVLAALIVALAYHNGDLLADHYPAYERARAVLAAYLQTELLTEVIAKIGDVERAAERLGQPVGQVAERLAQGIDWSAFAACRPEERGYQIMQAIKHAARAL